MRRVEGDRWEVLVCGGGGGGGGGHLRVGNTGQGRIERFGI
jgi:hypothetical protein